MSSFVPVQSPGAARRRRDSVACERIEDGAVLLHCARGDYHELDPVGLLVWESLDGSRGVPELAAIVCEHFEVDPIAAARDITAFLAELEETGLIVAPGSQ